MTTQRRFLSLTPVWLAVLVGLALTALLQGCAKRATIITGPLSSRGGAPGPGLGALGAGSEEVWILARGESLGAPSGPTPGSGALLARVGGKEVALPLKHTGVRASVSGYIGTVEVTQQFLNPYSRKIEAVYVFPLPPNAAVNEFILTIGERRIRGIIRERSEAAQLYQEAKHQGYVASLLTEERPNVFTQRVANLEPGKQIDVDLKYSHTLDYIDGWYEFVFPLVVGPRFNPPGTANGIGAVARGQTGASGQAAEIHYLRPGERTSHDLTLKLDVDAGVSIEEFECRPHQVTAETPSPERLIVSLAPTDSLPNKDFVLRYRVAGQRIKSGLLTHGDERGRFFTLMLYPPRELRALKRQPLELLFVLDCSASMAGRPLEQAKAAVERGLRLLQPEDAFQLVTFSTTASSLGVAPLAATAENVQRALRYLRSLSGEGGTMMLEGIKAALDVPRNPQRLRFVCVLTDGYVGNESEILGEVCQRLGAARIFSFGLGSSANRFLLDHLAKVGRGAAAYLEPNDSAAQIMEDFLNRISRPALTDLTIDWGGLHVTEVFPAKLPDLFVGRPVVVAGRFAGTQGTTIRVNGMAAGQPLQVAVPAMLSKAGATHSGLPGVWARMKIAELATRSVCQPEAGLPEEIRRIALDYSLLSPFTAFVAVDSTGRTKGSAGATVPVAVPAPAGGNRKPTANEN